MNKANRKFIVRVQLIEVIEEPDELDREALLGAYQVEAMVNRFEINRHENGDYLNVLTRNLLSNAWHNMFEMLTNRFMGVLRDGS